MFSRLRPNPDHFTWLYLCWLYLCWSSLSQMGSHDKLEWRMCIVDDKIGTKSLIWQGKSGGRAKTVMWEHVFECIFLLQKNPIQRFILSPPTIPSQVPGSYLAPQIFVRRVQLPCCDTMAGCLSSAPAVILLTLSLQGVLPCLMLLAD